MFMKSILLTILFFFFFYLSSYSQGYKNDTDSANDNVKQSIKLYDDFTGAEANIYNGREYIPYLFKKTGSSLFESDSLASGWISYEGRICQPIPIQYDVARDQVIILNYDGKSKIFLQNEAIDSFHFSNHTFIRLKENPIANLNHAGFYDLLLNGHIQVLASRKKNYKENIRDNEVIRDFYSQDQFYIHKGNKYFEVKNKNDVYRLLFDKRREIENHLHKQNIKFRRDNFEEALLIAATIYNQQTN